MRLSLNLNKRLIFTTSINILCITFTFYLLFEDFYIFSAKPTYASNVKDNMIPDNFPNMYLCPFPTFNFSAILKHGCKNDYYYISGKCGGWSGNASSSVEDIMEDISIFKSSEDCPTLFALFEDRKGYATLNFSLTKILFP